MTLYERLDSLLGKMESEVATDEIHLQSFVDELEDLFS